MAERSERLENEVKFSLGQARRYAGVSEKDAARAVGISAVTLSRYENGMAERIRVDTLQKLCELYNIPAEQIDLSKAYQRKKY